MYNYMYMYMYMHCCVEQSCTKKSTEMAGELRAARVTRTRDGTTTATQQFTQPSEDQNRGNYEGQRNGNVDVNRGLHESYDYYADCSIRQRNESECIYYTCRWNCMKGT